MLDLKFPPKRSPPIDIRILSLFSSSKTKIQTVAYQNSTRHISLLTPLLNAFISSSPPLGHKKDERTLTGNLQSSQFCAPILKALFVTAPLFLLLLILLLLLLSYSSVLTLRRLTSYIYGAPILDVSRSHTTTQHSR